MSNKILDGYDVGDIPRGTSVYRGDANINTVCPLITPTLGTELFTNNTFDTDTAWIKGAGWTIAGGVGVASGASTLLRQQPLTIGNWYQLKWDLVSFASGTCTGYPGIATVSQNTPGTYTTTGRATNINAGVNGLLFSGTVDNLYCKQISLVSMLTYVGDIRHKNGNYLCHPTCGVSSQCGMAIEYANSNNLVLVYVNRNDNKAYLEKFIGGVWTTLISGAITYSAGAELKAVVDGNNHSLFYNSIQIGSLVGINDAGLGTRVYGFNSLDGNTVGLVTTSYAGGGAVAQYGRIWYVAV